MTPVSKYRYLQVHHRFKDEWVIFLNIVKWFFLSTVVGILVGLSTTFFIKTLNATVGFTAKYPLYFLALPLGLFLSTYLTQTLAPEAQGHGTDKVIEAVHKKSGKINVMVVPVKLITTLITIASGGSVGKEGPCAQIGGGLASAFADIFRFNNHDRRVLVICGISAGFAAVFGTPIAGAIFGVEVLSVGQVMYEVLMPSFIAGITAFQISSYLGITYFNHNLPAIPVFNETFFVEIILAGLLFGLCSFLLIKILKLSDTFSERLKMWLPFKALLGGGLLIGLSFLFSTHYLGLGLNDIESFLNGASVVWYAFLLKMIFTGVTLAFGGSGGIITPVFYCGAAVGVVVAKIFHLNTALLAAVGMVSLLAGAANTPISASIMAIEMFGAPMGAIASVSCIISFLMTGHRSVYPSQLLSMSKARGINIELGKEMKW